MQGNNKQQHQGRLHYLLLDSGASTHVCPRQLPVYGTKYVPYQKDNFKIMIPHYVCDVKYPILSASGLLDRGYNLKLDTQHCLLSHGDNTAPLLRQRGLFYLAIKRIYIPKGHGLQPLMDHDGVMRAVTQPITTDNRLPQHNTIAPLTHTDQGLRRILRGNTDYWQLDGDYAIKRPRKDTRRLRMPITDRTRL